VEWACRVAATLKDARRSGEADDLCGDIVITLDDIDQPRKALLTLDTIQDPFIRAACLLSMAERRADKGNLDEGIRLAQRSLEGLDTMDRAIDRIDTQAAAAHAFARCGDVAKARNLAGKALEGLGNLDSQWHARPLGYIAAAAVLTDDGATGDRAVALARNDLMESDDSRPLVEVARQIARTGHLTELERIINTDEVLADSKLRQDLGGPVMRAYLDANHLRHALRIWRGLLGDDQLAGLADLTRTLNRGVHVLAALDDGHTLIALHQVMSEIRGWWPSSWSATLLEPQHSAP